MNYLERKFKGARKATDGPLRELRCSASTRLSLRTR